MPHDEPQYRPAPHWLYENKARPASFPVLDLATHPPRSTWLVSFAGIVKEYRTTSTGLQHECAYCMRSLPIAGAACTYMSTLLPRT